MTRRWLLVPLLLAGCSPAPAPAPVDGAASPQSAAPPATRPPEAPSPPASATATATAAASAAPTGSDAAPPATASAGNDKGKAKAEPLPDVKVTNIGMHIGGGPNDAPTKAPIKRSVEPHFDAFRICFAKLEERKGGDFGIDLRIGRDGGKAKVSHPRTALKGKEFEACMVAAFEAIEFDKPKGGDTMVSYSVRFAP